jgi:uncharacterized membrane protein
METTGTNVNGRIWEIDFLRGIAILLMIAAHLLMDFQIFFGVIVINFMEGWGAWARQLFNVFVFLAGVSCTFSRANFLRGLKLFGVALLVSLGSWIIQPDQTVIVGILHLLALSMMIWPLVKKWSWPALVALGVASIGLGVWFLNTLVPAEMPWKLLVPLGLQYRGFMTMDYFPLFPYIGVFFLGGAAGKAFYRERKSLFKKDPQTKSINWLGRHTLSIYLFHQLLLIPVLIVISKVFGVHFIIQVPDFLKFLFN